MITVEHVHGLVVAGFRSIVADAGLPLDGLGDVDTDLFVARQGETPIGVAALEHHGSHGLLRSVAVVEDHRGRGIGSMLVAAAEAYARDTGVDGVFLLTDTAAAFFAERGYQVIARDAAPAPVMGSVEWSVACGETAVPMVLR